MQVLHRILHKHGKLTVIIASVLAVLILLCVGAAVASAVVLSQPEIYSGVYIGDLNVGGMTIEEAQEAVTQHFTDIQSKTVHFTMDEFEKELTLSELSAQIDLEQTVQQAYEVGRTNSPFGRIKEILHLRKEHLVLPPVIACDDALLESIFSEAAALYDQPGKDMELTIGENELTIVRGVAGNCLNIPKSMVRFKETALSLENGVFQLALEAILPTEPNAEVIFNQICGDPVDATYKIENQKLVITEEKPGVDFNKATAQSAIDSADGDVITFPIVVIPPEVTAEQIRSQLFTDLLGTYSSRYNTGDTSRSHNVSLASQKINEVVLAPGDVFSYNDTVGPRTLAQGFKTANVYVGNRVEPGVGGGICQVSSTLFNAVVLSDLKIVQRTSHSLPVSYVPLGRDATVSYGSIDFKFSNNTAHPIKIVASAGGGTNKVSVYGVKENPAKTIEMRTECTGTIPSKLVQKEEPTLPVGEIKVEQKGSDGSYYNTYKVTLENGTVVKSELLTKSTYVAADRIELVGTMPVETPEGAETVLPEDTEVSGIPADGTTPSPAPEAPSATPPIPEIVAPGVLPEEVPAP